MATEDGSCYDSFGSIRQQTVVLLTLDIGGRGNESGKPGVSKQLYKALTASLFF
jgi:hypothetical protein